MTAKEQLLHEIEQAPEELIQAILNLLRSIKAQANSTTDDRAELLKAEVSLESTDSSLVNVFAEFDRFAQSIPAEEVANLSADSAEQHDHYLYGTLKRPT